MLITHAKIVFSNTSNNGVTVRAYRRTKRRRLLSVSKFSNRRLKKMSAMDFLEEINKSIARAFDEEMMRGFLGVA